MTENCPDVREAPPLIWRPEGLIPKFSSAVENAVANSWAIDSPVLAGEPVLTGGKVLAPVDGGMM